MAVEETQFLYGRAVKPRMVRRWGSWIFQFTEYPTMMLELMGRLTKTYGKDGRKALGLYALALIGTWFLRITSFRGYKRLSRKNI